ncbi:MAG: hypothetical protein ABW110_18180 [Steroidobacteraceae bacterium]
MSDPQDKKSDSPPPAPDDGKRSSGRVAFDSRGNSVWEWQVQTGVYTRDVNTESVRKLDLDDLSLEDTGAVRALEDQPSRSAPAPKLPKLEIERAGGGFNPYDNSSGSGPNLNSRDPYNNARLRAEAMDAKQSQPDGSSRKPGVRRPVSFAKQPPTELKKLSGWMKLKRALTGKRG